MFPRALRVTPNHAASKKPLEGDRVVIAAVKTSETSDASARAGWFERSILAISTISREQRSRL